MTTNEELEQLKLSLKEMRELYESLIRLHESRGEWLPVGVEFGSIEFETYPYPPHPKSVTYTAGGFTLDGDEYRLPSHLSICVYHRKETTQ